jgi:hypothetical protein
MTGGPKATSAGHLGLVGWGVAQPDRLPGTPATGHGDGYGAGRGGGKGAAGPEAHPGCAGGVGLAGGWPETTNFGGGGAHFRRGIRGGGGDSRHLGSIPLARSKRTSRRTFSARRRGWGRHRMAALGGGHGLLGGFS